MKLMIEHEAYFSSTSQDFYVLKYKRWWWPFWKTLKESTIYTYNTDSPPQLVWINRWFRYDEIVEFVDKVTEETLFEARDRNHRYRMIDHTKRVEEWKQERAKFKAKKVTLKIKRKYL